MSLTLKRAPQKGFKACEAVVNVPRLPQANAAGCVVELEVPGIDLKGPLEMNRFQCKGLLAAVPNGPCGLQHGPPRGDHR